MKEFQYLTLRGMPFFADQSFDLSQKGISLILGRNLDSSNHGTNGCGKSLFFSQLPEIMIGEPTIGVSKDVIRKGESEFAFKDGENHYVVNRRFKPGEKITIFKNGKDMEIRELSVAKATLRKLLPYNEEEVLSLLYLDSRIPHPVVRGTSAIRKAFFTNFFRMNSANTMRKVVKSELDGINTLAGSYTVRRQRLKEINAKLSGNDLEALQAKQRKLKAKLKELEVVTKRYSDAERVRDDYLHHKEAYVELQGMGVHTWAEAQAKSEKIEAKINSITEQIAEWKRYDSWAEGQAELLERKRVVKQKLKSHGELAELSGDQITAKVKAAIEEIEALDAKREKVQTQMREVSESREDDMKRDLKAARAKEKELEEASGECPTCGAAYDNKHAKKELRILDGRITDIQVHLEELLEKRAALAPKATKMIDQYAVLEEELDTLRKVRKLILEREEWEEQETMKPPKTDKDALVEARGNLKDQFSTLLGSRPVIFAVEGYKALSREDRDLLKSESSTTELLQTHEKLGELKMQIEEVAELLAEKEELTTIVKDLRAKIDDKPALEVLFEGLSQKGAPSIMINLVCDRLEQQVNKYARLLFPEDFVFKFELETQFNILVTRNYGKRRETSDVRKLSGAESLLFSMILLVALLSFVPAKNRCNLLILDEPTAAFGPEMINAFVKFLPVLNSVIPHIIVITPLPNNSYAGAKVYTVVKKNGKSRIIEGTDVTKGLTNDHRRSGRASGVAPRRKAAV